MALLSWLSGGSGKARRLLADYVDDCFVHAGALGVLSREQRAANLGAFVASIDRRIARLLAFAAALGTALPTPDRDRGKVEAIGLALDRLCKTRLCGLTAVVPVRISDWRAREPQGPERQVQTLLIDLGVYCGEVGIRCAPKYRWVIDETRYTPTTIMETSGGVVIGHNPAMIAGAMNNPVDVIGSATFGLALVVHFRKSKSLLRPNHFHFLSDLADGRHV